MKLSGDFNDDQIVSTADIDLLCDKLHTGEANERLYDVTSTTPISYQSLSNCQSMSPSTERPRAIARAPAVVSTLARQAVASETQPAIIWKAETSSMPHRNIMHLNRLN